MIPQDYAKQLLEEWALCQNARPKKNAVDIQLDKDVLKPWAAYLERKLSWGNDHELVEACYQFDYRLKKLKEKLIIEVLQNGSV